MRSTFKTVFYVNGSKERNGVVPIMGRVTINGTIAQFSCKLSVTKAIWDAKGNIEKTIADAVKSALSQKANFKFNVIVVNNHSTDRTGEIHLLHTRILDLGQQL